MNCFENEKSRLKLYVVKIWWIFRLKKKFDMNTIRIGISENCYDTIYRIGSIRYDTHPYTPIGHNNWSLYIQQLPQEGLQCLCRVRRSMCRVRRPDISSNKHHPYKHVLCQQQSMKYINTHYLSFEHMLKY